MHDTVVKEHLDALIGCTARLDLDYVLKIMFVAQAI